jgi:hypothetical protein
MKPTAILLSCLILAATAFPQMDTPKPGPEHKRLDAFAGSWTLDGDVKPGNMGPGGKMSETEKCEWLEGNFFLVCRSDFKSDAFGNGSGVSIMGYSSDDKAYTYREFNSWGEFTDSKGSVDGDTWSWLSDEKMGTSTMKSRFMMKLTSASTYTFTYEISQDGTKWVTVMDGRAAKK